MAIRIRFGESASGRPGSLLIAGLALAALGAAIAWAGSQQGDRGLLLVGTVMAASGAWTAGLYRLLANRPPGRSLAGGLFAIAGLAVCAAAAHQRAWMAALPAGVLLGASAILLGLLPLPARAAKVLAVVRVHGPGLAVMAPGLGFTLLGIGGAQSEGVPQLVLIAAGMTIFLAGVMVTLARTGRADTILFQTVAALVATGLAATAVVFPPGLCISAFVVVAIWIGVIRRVIGKLRGRDPLAGWSDQRVMGLALAVTVLLALTVAGVLWQRSRARAPAVRLPAEAPESR